MKLLKDSMLENVIFIFCIYLLLRTLTEEEKLATNIDMSLLFSEAMLITAVFLFRTLAVWRLQWLHCQHMGCLKGHSSYYSLWAWQSSELPENFSRWHLSVHWKLGLYIESKYKTLVLKEIHVQVCTLRQSLALVIYEP